jgi:hypothetical protein
MTSLKPDDYEPRFAKRLGSFADAGVSGLRQSELKRPQQPAGSVQSTLSRRFGGGALVAATVIFGVLAAMWGISLVPQQPGIGATQSATQSPAPSEPQSSISAEVTPAFSMAPIPGDTPDPNATAPKGALIIPNLTVEELAAPVMERGLSCESQPSGLGGEAGVYYLYCVGDDTKTGYRYTVTVRYWTMDHINSYQIVALPLDASGDPSLAREFIEHPADVSFAGADIVDAKSWIAAKIADSACSDKGCTKAFGKTSVVAQSGVAGAWTMSVTGTAVSSS